MCRDVTEREVVARRMPVGLGWALTACLLLSGCARAGVAVPEGGWTDDVWVTDGGSEDDSKGEANGGGGGSGSGSGSTSDGKTSGSSGSSGSGSPTDGGTEPDADALPPVHAQCKQGKYTGTFEGTIGAFGLGIFPIDGTLEINVSSDSAGEILVADNGFIEGTDQDGNPLTAKLEGALDCRTLKFIGGKLVDGVYTRVALGMTVNFEGTLEGVYTPGDVPTVVGTWDVSGGLEEGNGTFEAMWVPP